MSMFNWFKDAEFTFDNQTYKLEDLTTRVVNDPANYYNSAIFEEKYISPGARPDIFALRFYDDVNLWWTFFVANNITPNEWPRDDIELDEWIDATYSKYEQEKVIRNEDDDGIQTPSMGWYTFSVEGQDQFHHFPLGEGFGSSQSGLYARPSSNTPITLRDSLIMENEKNRKIKVIRSKYIAEFVEDFRKRISSKID